MTVNTVTPSKTQARPCRNFGEKSQDTDSLTRHSATLKQITVQIAGADIENDLLFIAVEPSTTISRLKELIEFQSTIPPAKQLVVHGGQKLLEGNKTLEQCQITPDAMLAVMVINDQQQHQGQQEQHGGAGPSSAQRGGNQSSRRSAMEMNSEELRQRYLSSPNDLANLRYQLPYLADAINDPNLWKERHEGLRRQRKEEDEEQARDMALIEADEFDVEAQRRIAERIKREQINANYQYAREHHPEAFGRVTMLYIPVEVNGHPVTAFVDSGAQSTTMSPDCAERCGLMHLVDDHYSGIAVGAGTAKIFGRVSHAPIKVGISFLPCTFSVMEGKSIDLLFGLDMLKRHQAIIDLEKGVLRIQGNEIPFLGEADIPKSEDLRMEEPTIIKPDGAKIGGRSGEVKEEGSQAPAGSLSQPNPAQQAMGPSPFPEADITRLTDMGMGRDQAIQALTLAGGDVDAAANLMFDV